jgi:hypothetical protein
MNKYLKIAIGVLMVLVVIILLIVYSGDRPFNKVIVPTDNMILNRTELQYLDTIIAIGLDELEIKGVNVYLRPISIVNTDNTTVLKAHIIAGDNNQYLIEIDKSDRGDILNSVSHELIHLKQLRDGRLKVTADYILWNNDTITNPPSYFDREWEIEAKDLGDKLRIKIKNRLYE